MRPLFQLKSGRAQARAMKRAAERSRADRRRERPADIPMIVKTDYMLAPVEAVLTQMELRGTVDVAQDGTPIFQASDGGWYQTQAAIEGMAEFFEQWAIRNRKAVNVAPLRQLAARFKYSMPVDQLTLDAVREVLPQIRRTAGLMTVDEASSFILGTQVKEALEAAEAR